MIFVFLLSAKKRTIFHEVDEDRNSVVEDMNVVVVGNKMLESQRSFKWKDEDIKSEISYSANWQSEKFSWNEKENVFIPFCFLTFQTEFKYEFFIPDS